MTIAKCARRTCWDAQRPSGRIGHRSGAQLANAVLIVVVVIDDDVVSVLSEICSKSPCSLPRISTAASYAENERRTGRGAESGTAAIGPAARIREMNAQPENGHHRWLRHRSPTALQPRLRRQPGTDRLI